MGKGGKGNKSSLSKLSLKQSRIKALQKDYSKRASLRRLKGVSEKERELLRSEASHLVSSRTIVKALEDKPDWILAEIFHNLGRVLDNFSRAEHGGLFNVSPQTRQGEENARRAWEDYSKKTVVDFTLFSTKMNDFLRLSPYPLLVSEAEEGNKRTKGELNEIKRKLKLVAVSAVLTTVGEFHGTPVGEALERIRKMEEEVTETENSGMLSSPKASFEEVSSFLNKIFTLSFLDHGVKQTFLRHWEKSNGKKLSKQQKLEIIHTSPPVAEPFKFLWHTRSTVELLEQAEIEREREKTEAARKAAGEVEGFLKSNYILKESDVRRIAYYYERNMLEGRDQASAVEYQALEAHNKALPGLSKLPAYSSLDLVSRINRIKNAGLRRKIAFEAVKRMAAGGNAGEIHALVAEAEPEKTPVPASKRAVAREAEKSDFSPVLSKAGFSFVNSEKNRLVGRLNAIQRKRPAAFEKEFLPWLDNAIPEVKTMEELEERMEKKRREVFGVEEEKTGSVKQAAELNLPTLASTPLKEKTLRELLAEIEGTRKITPDQIAHLKKLAVRPSATPEERLEAAKQIILSDHAQAGLQKKLPHEAAFAEYLPMGLKSLTIEAVRQLKREGKLEPRTMGTAGRPALVVTRTMWHKYHPALNANA